MTNKEFALPNIAAYMLQAWNEINSKSLDSTLLSSAIDITGPRTVEFNDMGGNDRSLTIFTCSLDTNEKYDFAFIGLTDEVTINENGDVTAGVVTISPYHNATINKIEDINDPQHLKDAIDLALALVYTTGAYAALQDTIGAIQINDE